MITKTFEDLEIWKRARPIAKDIPIDFTNNKEFEFRNQMYSAGYSILNTISEVFGRASKKRFHRFLAYLKGSTWEVKNSYYIAEAVGYINAEKAIIRREACE